MAKSESLNVYFAAPASLLGTRISSILFEPAVSPAWKRLTSAGGGIALAIVFIFVAPQFSLGFYVAGEAPSQIATNQGPQIREASELARRQVQNDCPKHRSLVIADAINALDCVLIPTK
jgi:hypothetical protein